MSQRIQELKETVKQMKKLITETKETMQLCKLSTYQISIMNQSMEHFEFVIMECKKEKKYLKNEMKNEMKIKE